MKKHFIALFDVKHRRWTFSFLLLAVILIVVSDIVTISDNPPGIALLYSGVVFLFLTIVHPWRKVKPYLIMAGICALIMALIFIGLHVYDKFFFQREPGGKPTEAENIIEAIIFMTVLFGCVPGLFIGIVGAITRAIINNISINRKLPDPTIDVAEEKNYENRSLRS